MLVCMGVASMFVAYAGCMGVVSMLVAWGLSVCWLHGGCQYSMMDVVDVHVV